MVAFVATSRLRLRGTPRFRVRLAVDVSPALTLVGVLVTGFALSFTVPAAVAIVSADTVAVPALETDT